MPFTSSGRTLWVGPGQQFQKVSAAVAASQSGDTINVLPGLYQNDFSTIGHDLRIVGYGGQPHLQSTVAAIPNAKAILLARNGADLVVENMEFSGAKVADHNGAGIRLDSGTLHVKKSFFHHNENGLFAGDSSAARVTVEGSEFAYNGYGDGHTHGLYANQIASLTVRGSYFHETFIGHHIKSKAAATTIIDNMLFDEGGKTSYNIDIPFAGTAVVRGNIIEQGAASPNGVMVNYGGERSAYSGSLMVEENQFISHRGAAVGVWNQTPITVRIEDNVFHDVGRIAAGPSTVSGNASYPDLSHVVLLRVSGDFYFGDPKLDLYVDGAKVGATTSVTADHAQAEWQTFAFIGNFGANGANEVAVRFVNDAYGGSAAKDRNLYVDWLEVDGLRHEPSEAVYIRSTGAVLAGREDVRWSGSLVFDIDQLQQVAFALAPPEDWPLY